ncbi:kinase-like domain-containing protein [Roridomyces roridus]|uniref:Kinase-like domain-containing protein n=1 Tax=Roridomyces roridus TaxID=1738132 RepID=A0AAD7BDU2_9AGAR|nr:kinase-like domain-containing protein [Roridomyces roridus]
MTTEASFTVKIIDFGRSFRPGIHQVPDPKQGPPVHKPPECNLSTMIARHDAPAQKHEATSPPRDSDLAWSTQGDIWVLGCTLFTIMVRCRFDLFERSGEAALFQHITEYMGPIPDRYRLLLEETANSSLAVPWDSKNCAEALDFDPALSEHSAIQENWVDLEEEVLDARRYWRTRSEIVTAGVHVDEEEDRKRVRVCLMVIRQMVGWFPEGRITASDAAALLANTVISNSKPCESPRLDDRREPQINGDTVSSSSLEDQNSEYLWELPSPPKEIEPLSRYHPGGLHPVHLTERYNDGRYCILNKLGFGSSSHVWLAHDTTTEQPLSQSRPLALKFIEAKAGDRTLEIEIHKYLTDLTVEAGPNGTHNVVVSDAVAFIPDLCKYKILEDLDETAIVRQIFQGVSFLHAHGVVHRDLHCGNIAIEIPLFRTAGLRELARYDFPNIFPCILSEAVEHSPSLPKYLVQSNPALSAHPRFYKDQPPLVVKLVDFGCAFRPGIDAFPTRGPRRALTAPECLVSEISPPEKVWTFESDIWTLGGTLVEIYSRLYTSEDDSEISANWRTLETSLVAARAPRTPLSAEDELHRVEQDTEDVRRFLSLIKQMLRWEPGNRIKAHDALNSAFFISSRNH